MPARMTTQEAAAILTWLDLNTVPRRFPPGLRAGYGDLQDWLTERGIVVTMVKGSIHLTIAGRRRKVSRPELLALVDDLRVAEGLPPLRLR